LSRRFEIPASARNLQVRISLGLQFLSDLIFSHELVAHDENRPGSNSKGSNMRPAHHVLARKTALNEFGQGREARAALEFGRTNTEPIAILREK
jgi:hypothetical protein